jgi:hypothetical protein
MTYQSMDFICTARTITSWNLPKRGATQANAGLYKNIKLYDPFRKNYFKTPSRQMTMLVIWLSHAEFKMFIL